MTPTERIKSHPRRLHEVNGLVLFRQALKPDYLYQQIAVMQPHGSSSFMTLKEFKYMPDSRKSYTAAITRAEKFANEYKK